VGGPGNDRIIAGTGDDNSIYAQDGEQDLICADRGSGTIQSDPEDEFVFNRSC